MCAERGSPLLFLDMKVRGKRYYDQFLVRSFVLRCQRTGTGVLVTMTSCAIVWSRERKGIVIEAIIDHAA